LQFRSRYTLVLLLSLGEMTTALTTTTVAIETTTTVSGQQVSPSVYYATPRRHVIT